MGIVVYRDSDLRICRSRIGRLKSATIRNLALAQFATIIVCLPLVMIVANAMPQLMVPPGSLDCLRNLKSNIATEVRLTFLYYH